MRQTPPAQTGVERKSDLRTGGYSREPRSTEEVTMRTYPAFEDFYDTHPELFDQSAGRLIDVAIANERVLAEGRIEIPPDPSRPPAPTR